MSNSINTNVQAQVALQTLNNTNASLNATQNRISTGLKVQDAKDDSAVWSIAQTMRSQNSALDAVTASLNRGKSTLDVANTAGTAISDLLTQMQQAVLAASDNSLDTTSRNSYQQKYASLAQQIKTYIQNAQFNGVNMLDGTTSSLSSLANADATSTITAIGQNLSLATSSTGGQAAVPSVQTAGAVPSSSATGSTGNMTLSQSSSFNVSIGGTNLSINLPAGGYTANQIRDKINQVYQTATGNADTPASVVGGNLKIVGHVAADAVAVTGGTGDLATNSAAQTALFGTYTPVAPSGGPPPTTSGSVTGTAAPTTPTGVPGLGISANSTITLQTDDFATFTVNLPAGYYTGGQLATAINNAYSATGKTGSVAAVDGTGHLQLTGVNTTSPVAGATGDFTTATVAGYALGIHTTSIVTSYSAATQFTETGGGGVIKVSGNETFTNTTNYADLIQKLKDSIAAVSSALGTLGAANNAMTNHLTFVSKLQDSLTAGVGNLVDADVAKESANLTAQQTKQQLGIQALSIANSAPQAILSLFKG